MLSIAIKLLAQKFSWHLISPLPSGFFSHKVLSASEKLRLRSLRSLILFSHFMWGEKFGVGEGRKGITYRGKGGYRRCKTSHVQCFPSHFSNKGEKFDEVGLVQTPVSPQRTQKKFSNDPETPKVSTQVKQRESVFLSPPSQPFPFAIRYLLSFPYVCQKSPHPTFSFVPR